MAKYSWLAAAVFTAAAIARADTVTMNNGDKITGTILEVHTQSIIVQSPYAGKLTIDRAAVKTLQSDQAVAIMPDTGAPRQVFVSPAPAGTGWQETAAFVPPVTTPPRYTSFLSFGPAWKNQLALGASNTTGNNNSTSVDGSVLLHYLKGNDEFTFKVELDYALTNGQQTAGLFDQNAVYRHAINDKWYLYADDDVRYDAIMGISLQAQGTGGVGYWLFKGDKFKWDVRSGPGVTYLKRFDGSENTSPALEAGTRMEYLFNDRISATQDTAYTTSLTEGSIWHIHSETALLTKLDIESGLGLKLAFDDDYENSATADKKRNDTRLTLALTLDF